MPDCDICVDPATCACTQGCEDTHFCKRHLDLHNRGMHQPHEEPTGPSLEEKIHALDRMERDVSPWETAFLETAVRYLRAARKFSPRQVAVVDRMFRRYIEGVNDGTTIEPEEA